MKKFFRNFVLIAVGFVSLAAFSGCSLISYIRDGYYISVKNDLGRTVTVTVEEDPRTLVSQEFGNQKESLKLKRGVLKRTNVVANDYFRFLVDGEEVLPGDDTGIDNVTDGEGKKFFFMGEHELVTFYEEGGEIFWRLEYMEL